MKKVWVAVVLSGALGVALLAGPTSAPAANCGNYAGSPVITKGEVPCRKAKAIVKEFIKVNKPRLQGYTCKGSDTKVFCKAPGGKSISWKK
jgi:hypothetical protein